MKLGRVQSKSVCVWVKESRTRFEPLRINKFHTSKYLILSLRKQLLLLPVVSKPITTGSKISKSKSSWQTSHTCTGQCHGIISTGPRTVVFILQTTPRGLEVKTGITFANDAGVSVNSCTWVHSLALSREYFTSNEKLTTYLGKIFSYHVVQIHVSLLIFPPFSELTHTIVCKAFPNTLVSLKNFIPEFIACPNGCRL